MPHWAALLQSTQAPEPLQKSPVPHAVLMAKLVNVGVPAEQLSLVHWLLSFGRSVLSTAFVVPPAPLQRCSRESPAVWLTVGSPVLRAVLVRSQVLLLQVKV